MLINVKVKVEARRETFVETKESTFEIVVREKAERNAANTRVRQLVARYFKAPLKSVRIVSGHHSPKKILRIVQS